MATRHRIDNALTNIQTGDVEKYFNEVLEATDPQNAPNYNTLPLTEEKVAPNPTNKTTKPVYTGD